MGGIKRDEALIAERLENGDIRITIKKREGVLYDKRGEPYFGARVPTGRDKREVRRSEVDRGG